ncbi:MAG: PHP domain-containing protein [Gemmatimonadaceae bacterium]
MPWLAVVLSLVVIGSAAFAVDPLRDASTFEPMTIVHLVLSTGYLLLAPICNVFDTLSLMSLRQHLAMLASYVVIFVAWRSWRGARRGTTLGREVRAFGIALVALVVCYAVGALVPRPMAALAVESPLNDAVLVVDFHSHTSYSHDGAPWFSPEANRRWHQRAGYDVAYITDHRTVHGAEVGIAANPDQAGQSTMILQGLEVVWDGAHVNVLGAQRTYRGLMDDNLRDLDDTSLAMASMVPNHEPIVIFTFPDELRHLHPAKGPGTPGVRAIEIVDGSPRGLGETRRKRTVINTVADTFNLALVSGTDNHGWGYTAPAWTLIQLPGWRGMGTDSLAEAIDRAIRTRGVEATRVVERRQANTSISRWRLAATLPLVTARMFTMLSENERVSWLIWIWGLVLIRFVWRRRRRPPSPTARRA